MQGMILSVASEDNLGVIRGEDSVRYTFALAAWRDSDMPATQGMQVDFEVQGSRAVGIYLVPALITPQQAAQQRTQPSYARPSRPANPRPRPSQPSYARPSRPANPWQAHARTSQAPYTQQNVYVQQPQTNGELYFITSGRINRSTFWLKGILLLNVLWVAIMIALLISVIAFVYAATDGRLGADDSAALSAIAVVVLVILGAVYLWNNFAITVKRLHDRDKSAWWVLIWMAIFIVGGALTFGIASFAVWVWIFIELGCLAGTPGENRYDLSRREHSDDLSRREEHSNGLMKWGRPF